MSTTTTRDLIVFGEDWGALPSSTQHLIQHLRKDRKVLWVNSIGLRQPSLNIKDIRRVVSKLFAKSQPVPPAPQLGSNHFQILHPKTLPAPRSIFARWISRLLLLAQLKPVISNMGLKSPVLWTSLPTAVDLSGYLDEHALVYYCGDDFGSLAGVDHETVSSREEELISKADLIFSVSQKLNARFPKTTSHLLPHGVDYPLFSTPTSRAPDFPDNGKPTAGFYGSISDWMDIPLLEKTIKQLPDWNFVFIGKANINIDTLEKFNNTFFLGEKKHSDLPSYSQHWTASLLPFKRNQQIDACNPLKLREYLAVGKPIISTAFPSASEYQAYIHIIDNASSMVEALKDSVTDRDCYFRKQSVSNQTWEVRASSVSRWLNAL